ncbi:VOC family protein [Ideonella sp. BN130291]|uniref:VOC family protein n=1 Tax=Ideonella sp. BN130291 TaxID=3112940 RepID=UPI002E259C9C|nr:VOC family protein [Ideonella sp. BN130291]
MSVVLDHLVVVARTLAQGVQWCEATLGVTPGPGGRHPLMGTHNRLLNISAPGFERAYLEIIAIDPQAEPPTRARWFGMDSPALQAAVAHAPQLVHWVGRSDMLDMHRWGLVAGGLNAGEPVAASRDTPAGRLQWRMLLRDDGQLLNGGALPTLIEWTGPHPTDTMPDAGLQLLQLTVRGLPAKAAEVLRPRGVELAAGEAPTLQVRLHTPRGEVLLTSAQDMP